MSQIYSWTDFSNECQTDYDRRDPFIVKYLIFLRWLLPIYVMLWYTSITFTFFDRISLSSRAHEHQHLLITLYMLCRYTTASPTIFAYAHRHGVFYLTTSFRSTTLSLKFLAYLHRHSLTSVTILIPSTTLHRCFLLTHTVTSSSYLPLILAWLYYHRQMLFTRSDPSSSHFLFPPSTVPSSTTLAYLHLYVLNSLLTLSCSPAPSSRGHAHAQHHFLILQTILTLFSTSLLTNLYHPLFHALILVTIPTLFVP